MYIAIVIQTNLHRNVGPHFWFNSIRSVVTAMSISETYFEKAVHQQSVIIYEQTFFSPGANPFVGAVQIMSI